MEHCSLNFRQPMRLFFGQSHTFRHFINDSGWVVSPPAYSNNIGKSSTKSTFMSKWLGKILCRKYSTEMLSVASTTRNLTKRIKSTGMPNVFNTVCCGPYQKWLWHRFISTSTIYRYTLKHILLTHSHTYTIIIWQVVKYHKIQCEIAFVWPLNFFLFFYIYRSSTDCWYCSWFCNRFLFLFCCFFLHLLLLFLFIFGSAHEAKAIANKSQCLIRAADFQRK